MIKLFYIAQSEFSSAVRGVIQAQVVGALRAQSQLPDHPPAKLIFLEAARVAASRRGREIFAAYRAMWPAGKLSLAPFVGRLGAKAAGWSLAANLWRERFTHDELVFHCRGPAATCSAAVARRWLGRGRVLFDIRGHGPLEAIHRLGYVKRAGLPPAAEATYQNELRRDRAAAEAADHIFAVCPGLVRYAIEELGAAPDRVTLTPSCVDAPHYRESDRNEVRTLWQAGDAPVLLYAGRLGPERLPDMTFRLFRAVHHLRPAAQLVLITYLNDMADLKQRLHELHVPLEAIRFESHGRDETVRRMCGADVGLHFLEDAERFTEYTFPIKIAEYLAAGLALAINGNMRPVPELVRQRQLGWVLNEHDADEALARTAADIVRAFENNRHDQRSRALKACDEVYTWRRYLPAFREAYGLAPLAPQTVSEQSNLVTCS